MSDLASSPRLTSFVQAIERLVDYTPDEAVLLDAGRGLLATLVANDDWLPEAYAQPSPDRYSQYLLHRDPKGRFSVVSFVWGPGQATPVHDHTVWGLVGVLRGAEMAQSYEVDARGVRALAPPHRLAAGEVEAVSPTIGDIHKVWNAYDDRVSISIHLYGADIGQVSRHTFGEGGEQKTFISGYTTPAHQASARSLIAKTSPRAVRHALLAGDEIALIDLREEGPYALAHPLFAAQLSPSRLELDVFDRIPRKDTPVVLYDDGEGLVAGAARTLTALGYTDVTQLDGGLQGWSDAGYELFQDVNSASKAFGELVEARRHTPYITAEDARTAIEADADVVVLDARRFDEYRTMSIPKGVSVPGAELVLRAQEIAPDPATTIIVNCAGRTRSIIGAQSLINAGVPNRVLALRNGTIGWTLAGQSLETGREARFPEASHAVENVARTRSRRVAYRAGVKFIDADALAHLEQDARRTLYRFDVRTPEEYAAGRLPEFRSAPGGQLVQETDMFAPVRGARIVVYDDRGVRANMTASWLAQMGWETFVFEAVPAPLTKAAWRSARPAIARAESIGLLALAALLERGEATVVDLSPSKVHARGHIPGAWFAIRARLADDLARVPANGRLVFAAADEDLAHLAARDHPGSLVLAGGTDAWTASGLPVETGIHNAASAPDDIYRRPYEGTDNATDAMQAYLDWEYGLVAQLERDATHGFRVI